MGLLNNFLGKLNLSSEDDYDEDDDLDYGDENAEEESDEEYSLPVKATPKQEKPKKQAEYMDDSETDFQSRKRTPLKNSSSDTTSTNKVVPMRSGSLKLSEVHMVMPKGYETSSEIAEMLLEGKTVVLNMEGMNMDIAQRIIDFTSGTCFTMSGNLQKISKKIFIATPSNVELTGDFSEIIGDMVDPTNFNITL